MSWLLDQLRSGTHTIETAAAHQPLSVHELAEHLFAQYKVENGHAHLAGCSLEDRPFLRLTFLQPASETNHPRLVHCYGTVAGDLVESELRDMLELQDVMLVAGRTPHIDRDVIGRWSDLIRRQYETQRQHELVGPLIAVTIIWCKYAEGKLAFAIGKKSVEVPFAGWGQLFMSRQKLPPPYHCPESDLSSYHLAATDDGRITVVEALATCSASSRRVLTDELEVCSETGARALPEYMQTCPCTGQRVLATALESCEMCQQRVSPQSLISGRCCACHDLTLAASTDSDLAQLLAAYSKFARFRNWKMGESAAVRTFVGSSLWKRILVVCDKETLDVLHLATSSRFSHVWKSVSDEQRAEWLRQETP